MDSRVAPDIIHTSMEEAEDTEVVVTEELAMVRPTVNPLAIGATLIKQQDHFLNHCKLYHYVLIV